MESSKREIKLQEKHETPVFEEVYEAYAERILNLAYRFTGNEDTARDLTQEVFLRVYENLDRLEHKSHVYTWIYRIAVNLFTSYLKKEKRHVWLDLMDRKVSDLVTQGKVDPDFTTAQPTAPSDRILESSERSAVVWSNIQALSPKYRVPLVLHHYEGMSYKDIAAVLGISLSAVEARIHRAKKSLIKRLEPWLDKI